MQLLQHATCIDLAGHGILLMGTPGSGKSSLALQLIDAPGYGLGGELMRARLVADDQVSIRRDSDKLVASAPAALLGLLEIRGLGIMSLAAAAETRLALAVRLATPPATERLPEPVTIEFLGLNLPLLGLDASLAAAPARLRAALSSVINAG